MIERWRNKNVFESYLLMGPSRNLTELSHLTGIGVITLRKWSRAFSWNERVFKRDQKALSCIEAENDKILKETIMRRHQQAYQMVQEKALKFIDKHGDYFEDARDAAVALDIGVNGERKVLGLSDTRMKGAIVKEGIAAMIELVMSS